MKSKPKLIDLDLLQKVSELSKDENKTSLSSKFTNYIANSCLNFISDYFDFILVTLFLGIVLYFRYKFNIESKKKILKPESIEVNYHRTNEYIDGSLVDTKDKLEPLQETNENVIDVIKNKINEFENDLKPMNMNNLESYSNI
jgi:hypothetical protein